MDLTNNKESANNQNKELSEAQKDFLKTCQELGWGKLEVSVQNGEPSHSRLLEKTYQHKTTKH